VLYRPRRPQKKTRSFARLPRWSARRWYVTTFALLGLSACGLSAGPALSKVVVDQLATDVIFGAGQPSPSPLAPPLPQLGLQQPLGDFFTGNNFSGVELTTNSCAVAPPTAAPPVDAAPDVTAHPQVGQYRWVGGGTYDVVLPTNTLKFPVPQNLNVDVTHVTDVPDEIPAAPGSTPDLSFTYQTIQPNVGRSGFLAYTWKIKANAQTGDPEGGLTLTQVDLLDASGKVFKNIFKGTPGLLLMNLPAQSGPVGIQGPNGGIQPTVAADTSGNNNNMQFTGSVGSRERIDACGTWVQAWPIDGTLQIGTGTATVHLDVATQFGGLVEAFNIDGSYFGTTLNKLTMHTGQTTPDALPAQFK
jgi:hypothetical protein